MGSWEIKLKKSFSCKEPIFIEGLPGIGNVGKVVVDYVVDKLKAKKIGSFFSYDLPHSVFVDEKNLVQLPSIEMYHLNIKGQDFIFLTGDAQPSVERSSYELSEEILNILVDFNTKQIITVGGIGLNEVPENPETYVTGNNKSFISEFVSLGANKNIYGVVGPIVGVSGLLLGLSKKKKIPAAALLGETFGHPMYIGLKEARNIILMLNKKYGFKVDLKDLDKEIKSIEEELENDKPITKKYSKTTQYKDTNYIG